MNKPKLLYSLQSPPSRTVLLFIKLLKLDVELKQVNFDPTHDLTKEKVISELLIPVLTDNKVTVWDSFPIIIYLLQKYRINNSVCPPNNAEVQVKVTRILHIYDYVLFPILRSIAINILVNGKSEYQSEIIKTFKAYDKLETILNINGCLIGTSITIADLLCITVIETLQMLVPIDTIKWPKLFSWMSKMCLELPDYDNVNEMGAEMFAKQIKDGIKKNFSEKNEINNSKQSI